MKITRIPFSQVRQLSSRDVAYQTEAEVLKDFYTYPVTIEAFKDVINEKQKQVIDRQLLCKVLNSNYQNLDQNEKSLSQISLLEKDNSFTIITAHQPSLLTGPLYYIYKISSAINLATKLKEQYPEYNFIPAFVSGGEDHDFEEINHLHIYNQRVEWQIDHNGEPTGRMPLDGMPKVLEELENILRENSDASKLVQELKPILQVSKNYGEFTFRLIHKLFGEKGLLFINMDSTLR